MKTKKKKTKRKVRRYKVKGKNGIVHRVVEILADEYPVGDGYVGMAE